MSWIKDLFDRLGAGRAKGEGRRIKDYTEPHDWNWAQQVMARGKKVCRFGWPKDKYVLADLRGVHMLFVKNKYAGEYTPTDEDKNACDWMVYV